MRKHKKEVDLGKIQKEIKEYGFKNLKEVTEYVKQGLEPIQTTKKGEIKVC